MSNLEVIRDNSRYSRIDVLRLGQPYESLDLLELAACGDGRKLLAVSQANAGLIRRDLAKIGNSYRILQALSCERMLKICAKAGALFMHETLPLGAGTTQTPQEYAEQLSATGGLPLVMIHRNMKKIHQVFTEMPAILKGLTLGLDLRILDAGRGEQAGVPVSFFAVTQSLGVVLPSNSPGVNSLWMPAIALKIPVILKPGREDPWTPWRIIQAFIAAGCPPEAFGFYPTSHEGAAAILSGCGRALLFGDEFTTAPYAANPAIQIHGPGRSKVLIGKDAIEDWTKHLEVLVESISANGGRSCVNASAIVVPSHGSEIAEALAKRLGPIQPRGSADEAAPLAGFANPKMAEAIDAQVEEGLRTPGAEEVTAPYRKGSRKVEVEGISYLRPTVVRCDGFSHPLANREFLFPYASVVEIPQEHMLEQIGPSLVVTAITQDQDFIHQLLASPHIGRLNLGSVSTTHVSWDQPHEGNLFEFLYKRRALQSANEANISPNNLREGSRYSRIEFPGFDYQPLTRVVFGNGCVERVGEFVRDLPARKALLVTDPGIVAAGHAERVRKLLESAGVTTVVFDRVKENPSTREVDECLQLAKASNIDAFVGLGGGSSLDTAKGCNFLLTNGGRMQDYWGIGKATRPLLPLIAIPTTAGTGSECQSFALIADATSHQKMACGDSKAAARVAILDPELTCSQPRSVTACTGVDALAHAVETAVTRKRNGLSMLFSREAFVLGQAGLHAVLENPSDLSARGQMQWAAALAGMAIENSMLGAAHAAANPLTAHFGIVHGQAVGLLLPHVVRYNGVDEGPRAAYAELAAAAGLVRRDDGAPQALNALVSRLEVLLNLAGLPRSLKEAGVDRTQISTLAQEAARQWTAGFNPREITAEGFEQLYAAAFEPRGVGESAGFSQTRSRSQKRS